MSKSVSTLRTRVQLQSRVTRRAAQRARTRKTVWITSAVVFGVPLLVLLWPVKSLFWYLPRGYAQFFLSLVGINV